ncbi:MAG: hypothetical protein WEC54_03760 [Gemmatimonadales bacterium]
MTRLLALLAVCAAPACGATLGPDTLSVTLSISSPTFPADGPFGITVTAVNQSSRRVQWGEGSSGCQLDAVIRVDGRDYSVLATRVCTADFGPHALEPGASRTETWTWEGEYLVGDDGLAPVPPGTYEFRGRAGHSATSTPVLVTVSAP